MQKDGTTYSESWHLVANLRLKLRSTVEVQRQFYRGEKWYVLRDPFNNRFFRVQPAAYDFIMRLNADRTVEEVWLACMEDFSQTAPGQADVVMLLGQMYSMNLLDTDVSPDTRQMFSRYTLTRRKELRSQLMNILFIRLPLFDPEKLLERFSGLIHKMLSPAGAVVWLITLLVAIKLVVDNADVALDSAQAVLAPDNLFLLYLGLIFVKAFHEIGHAVVCHRYGGEVHTMGLMFMLFTPLPYMDATSSWGFRSRWQRAYVGAAGMVAELFIASLAAMYWAVSGQGALHSLAYNIMFVASVSTVLFNANPLLRLDGYYILSDLLDIPNLSARSTEYIRYLLEHFIFNYNGAVSSAKNRQEAIELTLYGVLSAIYKVMISLGIILFIADKWLILGTILAIVGLVTGVFLPTVRFISYLFLDSRLLQCRRRIIAQSALFLAVFTLVTILLPFPHNIYAPGVVESFPDIKVVNMVSGHVKEYLVTPGQHVVAGQPLVRLENKELLFSLMSAESRVVEMRVKERQALGKTIADLKPVLKELRVAQESLVELRRNEAELIVRARANGIWIPANKESISGLWVERGRYMGDIVGGDRFQFAAVVAQEEVSELFDSSVNSVEVRLWGEAHQRITIEEVRLIPYQHEKLPSPALGQMGGGNVSVQSTQQQGGDNAAEPFFLVNALLENNSGAHLLHGRSGTIRFTLEPKPLMEQWSRYIYQLFQKRYRL